MATDRKKSIELGVTRVESGRTQRAVLELRTSAFDGVIRSMASVIWNGDGFVTFIIFKDFSKRVTAERARGTQKNIDAQHAAAFTDEAVAGLLAEVRAFYKWGAAVETVGTAAVTA